MSTIVVCDVCGTRKDVSKVSFLVGRSMDAAGSMEDDYETFDLCLLHHKEILSNTMKEIKEKFSIDNYIIGKISVSLLNKRIP